MREKSLEVYYEKMRQLSDIDNTTSHKSNPETLIEHVVLNDGSKLGIIKNAHNYYVKKSTSNTKTLNESHFEYIGGIGNSTNYAYKSLSIAQKQLNIMEQEYNNSLRINELAKKKKFLNENSNDLDYDYVLPWHVRPYLANGDLDDLSDEEIKEIQDFEKEVIVNTPEFSHFQILTNDEGELRYNDLNRFLGKTFKVKVITKSNNSINENLDDDLNDLQILNDKISNLSIDNFQHDREEIEKRVNNITSTDNTVTSNDNVPEKPVEDKVDVEPSSDEDTPKEDNGEKSGNTKEIEKMIGKITYDIRNSELSENQTKSFFNSLLSSFKTHINNLDNTEKMKLKSKINNELFAEEEIDETVDLNIDDAVVDNIEGEINNNIEIEETDELSFLTFLSNQSIDVNDLSVIELVITLASYITWQTSLTDDELIEILNIDIVKNNIDEIISELDEMGFYNYSELIKDSLHLIEEDEDITLTDMGGEEDETIDLDTTTSKGKVNVSIKDNEINIQLSESEIRNIIKNELNKKRELNENLSKDKLGEYVDFIIDKYF